MASPNWYVVSNENPGFKGLDLDFVAGRYAADSPYSSILPPGFYITRNSIGTAENVDGSMRIFAAGKPRITDNGLLVEEGRATLSPYSTDPTKVSGVNWWFATSVTMTPGPIEMVGDVAFQSAIIGSTGATWHRWGQRYASQPAGENLCATVYMKQGTSTFFRIGFRNETTATESAITGEWARPQNTYSIASSAGAIEILENRELANGVRKMVVKWTMLAAGTPSIAVGPGSSTAGLDIAILGMQVERGIHPLSFIVSGSTGETRLGDRVGISYSSGVNPWTTMAHVMMPYDQSTGSRFWEHLTNANNRAVVQRTASGNVQAIAIVEGTSVTHGSYLRTGRNRVVKFAERFDTALQLRSVCDGGGLSAAQNGSALVTSLEDIRIASQYSSNPGTVVTVLNGWVRQLVSYRRELSLAEMQEWTALT